MNIEARLTTKNTINTFNGAKAKNNANANISKIMNMTLDLLV